MDGPDGEVVGDLVRTYLLHTEHEKVERGLAQPTEHGALPSAYRGEADDPALAYAGSHVLVAELDSRVVGVVVVKPGDEATELKRLWTDPGVRGRGVGSALLEAAIAITPGTIRLSVWDWRPDPIRLYESRGFTRVPSWEARERLVCMERS
ncbi:GNAT family N-acetyltransferase [Microbacterium murale]|uniref:GNAT family N-acetyltransferase n=1 Tax=Microbacterium murale TaxID=1081040 RepID=UPI0027D845E5|nr:GNAT family N-acetyltransferase [Microbacterium murale]